MDIESGRRAGRRVEAVPDRSAATCMLVVIPSSIR